MKLITLMCPNCKSPLDVDAETDRKTIYCQYCGSPVYIDDESININAKIDHTIRHVDDAKIVKHQAERDYVAYLNEKDKRDNKSRSRVLIGLVLFLVIDFIALFIMSAISERNDKIAQSEAEEKGYISVGLSSSECEGANYKSIVAQLDAAGFTNIEEIDLKDSTLFGKKKNNTVESVSIGGDTRFRSDDYFDPNSKIIVSYH